MIAVAIAMVINLSLIFGQNQQQPVLYGQPTSNLKFVKSEDHVVASGDNTWDISNQIFYDGYHWRDIASMNPFLENGKSRQKWYDSTEKIWYCELFPGEKILLGYHETQPEIARTSIDSVSFSKNEAKNGGTEDFSWLWWLLIPLVFFILWFLYQGRKWQNSDPIESGPPFVPGGINDGNASAIIGSRARAIVISIKKGKLYGKGKAFYNFTALSFNNMLNDIFGKRFNGEVGYEARVRMPDGTEKVVYCLQGCGNDVREGNFATGLTFVPDSEQPNVITTQNNESEKQEAGRIKEQNSTKEVSHDKGDDFIWQKSVMEQIAKAIDKDKKVFIEITGSSGQKFKFDSLNEPERKTSQKSSSTKSS